jgi:Transposase DDE domain group 1
MKFTISETDEILVSHSGLGLAGALLQGTGIQKRTHGIRLGDRKRPEVSHGDVLVAMIGLLCLGKPDFEAIEAFREDGFFRRALGLTKVPSEGTLRQRLDELEHRCDAILREESAAMVARHAPKLTPCYEDWVALDIDPSPFDNSGTKKEGVSWTYLKFDGYNPWFAYLGNEGYLVHCQLREGSEHCQDGMPQFLEEAIAYARRITPARLLVRMDAGHDDLENLRRCQKHKVDWIIKRNLRKESLEDWLVEAEAFGQCEEPREGKEVWTGETWKERAGKLYRVVFEVIRRTITADGQRLLVPEIEVATWWTSLKLPAKQVIELYHQHGTSEQFHSEIKSDMDLERLPSGKFATNALVLSLGQVAYNVLRLCGQTSLQQNNQLPMEKRMPIRKPVARRRLRSVIQDLMYLAARWTHHSHRWGLSFWRSNPWHGVWSRLYKQFTSRPRPAPS